MKLTDHFTVEEFSNSPTATRHGIDNTIPQELMHNVFLIAMKMEEVRTLLNGKPIIVSSGYRGPELNKLIGGSSQSAHMRALACDFICPEYGTPLQIAKILAGALTEFDQLIWEGTWVHLGLREATPRREVLTAKFPNGKAVYSIGLNEA